MPRLGRRRKDSARRSRSQKEQTSTAEYAENAENSKVRANERFSRNCTIPGYGAAKPPTRFHDDVSLERMPAQKGRRPWRRATGIFDGLFRQLAYLKDVAWAFSGEASSERRD